MRPATDHCLEQNRSVQPSPQSCMIMCALNSLNMLMIDAVDRWPVGYLLERLSNFPEFGERVFCRLLADLLFAPDDGDGSPLRGCELRIPPQEEGRLPCLAQNGYLSSEITSVNKSYALRRSQRSERSQRYLTFIRCFEGCGTPSVCRQDVLTSGDT